ncbi:ABC transporter ATP-binding protein [Pusillimonas noertemannii]|uniref:Urea ABC transporter ATP-binding protein n=1 Tax=Pusillimonas noertemannii TaxID=305977 RepID=A0A2U1CIR2_9BURK|nr:ABC transporter ATP-binding protein [Pusillimonas noertemannii]NYT70720.1 ABC transporter ATP-binding protein [Pusillimonas noertemannii]PVY60878.1 urea ABC transporter ATP-binding protein [Pusillimonas noertemannii]TFL08530.1 ABC transporter ATP-binding protein [Pusillimonas noertemannii]
MLEVHSIVKRFGGITVLNELSLSLQAGSVNCIIGPNGCGKTTLFNVLTGRLRPEGGRVLLEGRDITGLPAWRIAQLGMTRKFQIPGVYPELTVAENLIVPLAASNRRAGMLATLFAKSEDRLHALLDLCGLEGKAEYKVAALAHGEKQWLEIAMLLAVDADLILLDEPTAGMSVPETQKTAELVKRLRTEFGKTVLVIEHDMSFVRALDCHLIVMLRGQVVREGRLEDIQTDPEVIAAYLGGAVHAESE